ncbi:MAG: GTPase ObgE [Actinomycetota bacterium]
MTFVDEAVVVARAGRGGDGSASMRSEPYTPRGGPDGGNGGDGGSVILEVSSRIRDLAWLRDHPHLDAKAGTGGRSQKRDGARGGDRVLQVPDGTVVSDEQGLLADLVGEGARVVVARGGRGGRGNAAIASARNKAPTVADQGEPGEERRLELELRTVADLGLVGLPNAGKSTLLAALTAAKPKIADYPFTTLTPNLGVGGGHDERFVVADIPGLVEGASEGRGLGHRFLRHVTRCRALVLVVDLAAEDPPADLATVREELAAYDLELADRFSLVVGTKADLVDDAAQRAAALSPDALVVSATDGAGVEELDRRLGDLARATAGAAERPQPYVVLRPARARFQVTKEGSRYRVRGPRVERWVAETDFEDARAVVALQKRLQKEGVERQLAVTGARRGDEVVIGAQSFEFYPDEAPQVPEEADR